MNIIVACDGLQVSRNARLCECYTRYTVDCGVITDCRNLPNPRVSAKETISILKDLGIKALIATEISPEFANDLREAEIEPVDKAKGLANEAVEAYVTATLLGAGEMTDAMEDDEEDEELDSVFSELEAQFEAEVR